MGIPSGLFMYRVSANAASRSQIFDGMCICRVGQNHTLIGIYGVYTVIFAVFLAGKSPYIRSYTLCIYGFGQPYVYVPKKLLLTYIKLWIKMVIKEFSCLGRCALSVYACGWCLGLARTVYTHRI